MKNFTDMEPRKDKKGPKKKSKRDRFLEIAERRTNRIIKDLQSLTKCTNSTLYEYGPRDVELIFNAIDEEVRRTKAAFEHKGGAIFSLPHEQRGDMVEPGDSGS